MQKRFKIIALSLAFLGGFVQSSFAQNPRETADLAYEQNNGQYPEMSMDVLMGPLGMQQKAWNNPNQHLGEGQTKPGYSKYYWSPGLVMPIRVREGMVTLINFPTWELIENVFVGSGEAFLPSIVSANDLMITTAPGIVGVDSNMLVLGRSGNRYMFYLRSETYNADRITNAVVDVVVADENHVPDSSGVTPAISGGGSPSSSTSTGRLGTRASKGGGKKPNPAEGWLDDIPVDPEKLRFDIDVFIPNPEDIEIAPERVWRDEVFTYIDFGPKALSMLQRPIVNLLVQGSEVPVGFRTRGPNGRLVVVESIGDLVLRNGQRILCLKIRKDPTYGTEWVEYEPSVQKKWSPQPFTTMPVTGNTGGVTGANGFGAGGYPANGSSGYPTNLYVNGSSGYSSSSRPKTARRPATVNENIAVELGSDSEILALERKWDNISRKNKDLLGPFEPYFSVDTVTDGEAKDLFRLRVGPVNSIKEGDQLCNQLGRRGITCMVVRTQ